MILLLIVIILFILLHLYKCIFNVKVEFNGYLINDDYRGLIIF